MRIAVLCFLLVAAVHAEELPKDVAYVVKGSVEVSPDGRTIKGQVKAVKAGKYVVAGGYTIDKDTKFQFYKGGKSGQKAYDVKDLKVKAGELVDVEFTVKSPPALPDIRPRILLYRKAEDVPARD